MASTSSSLSSLVITFGVAISIRQVGVNSFKVKCASDVIYLRLPARYTFPIKSILSLRARSFHLSVDGSAPFVLMENGTGITSKRSF